jgi:thymidylate synthase
MNSKWPIYKDTMLILGNPKSQVAICALWTKKELVAEKLNLDKIAVIGNLYSPKKGISFMIRNICANPNIRTIVICGLDNSGSGQVIVDLVNNGFDKFEDHKNENTYWKARSAVENRIDIEIEEKALESFCRKIKVIDLRKENDFNKIQRAIDNIPQNQQPFLPEPLFFPESAKKNVNLYPSEPTAHLIRGEKIAEVWVKILDEILKFGITDQTSYQNQQKEIIDLISVVSNEDPNDLFMPDWLPNDKKHLENYLPTRLTGVCPRGASYTYGSRMREYFGVDQIQKVIDEIKKEKYSRRAVVSLLDPKADCGSKNPPCLNHCWFRIQNDRLHLVATLRSNDMFEAWPENAFGLRMLQSLVFCGISNSYPEVRIGDLVMHSLSAHIYDDSWDEARSVIDKHLSEIAKHPRNCIDPRGNFIIKVENDEISVEHYSPDEIMLNAYKGKKAMPIYMQISSNGSVSNINHAIYLGTELQKAEESIRLRIKYEQDKDLNYKRK